MCEEQVNEKQMYTDFKNLALWAEYKSYLAKIISLTLHSHMPTYQSCTQSKLSRDQFTAVERWSKVRWQCLLWAAFIDLKKYQKACGANLANTKRIPKLKCYSKWEPLSPVSTRAMACAPLIKLNHLKQGPGTAAQAQASG